MYPINAIAAASHPDPYPYYRQLAAGPELAFDADLKLWIASRAAVIREVMTNPHCLVRPITESVPKAIAGSSAGAIFGRLARMNEGAAHETPKRAIAQMLAAVDLARVERRTTHFSSMLQGSDGAAVTRWMFDLPTYVVADLLGLGEAELPQVALWVADFVRCLSPLSTPQQLERASTAAQALMGYFAHKDDVILANQVGLLSQTHEATAGLIGNAIVALLRDPPLQQRLRADPQQAAALVRDVARRDPAVQNTRRFVAQATSIAGIALQPGDTILLLLGAADPDQPCGFGHGRHACPGQDLACTIATSALQYLLVLPQPLALDWTYKPSANARLPQFL